jgi:hypothetical protein
MAKAAQALPYLQRVLEDEFVQEQLRSAVSGAREAYSRARKQRTQVVEDKGLYRSLRQAATALQRATTALKPEAPPPKRRGRKLATVALAIGVTAFITVKLQKQYAQRSGASEPATAAPSAKSGAEPQRPEAEPATTASPA